MFSKYSSYISSYKGFKELKYVDLLLLNLQRIKDVQGFKELQYVDLQLDLQRPTTWKVVKHFFNHLGTL